MPTFPFTHVVDKTSWSNFHGTIAGRRVPIYAILDAVVDTTTATLTRDQRHAQAIRSILEYAFTQNPPEPVRAVGATWSLSNIIEPSNVIIDPGAMNGITKVNPDWLTEAYTATCPDGAVPMIVQGGTNIQYLSQKLGEIGLSLQTSGASDGHRIAGLIATGTHGSAIDVGAVHDTVLAIHLIVGPNRAILLQPEAASVNDDLAEWFQMRTGIPTESRKDNDQFFAAQVAVGSIGIVHSVVIETVPSFLLQGRMIQRPLGDAAVYEAVRTMDTCPLHPDTTERPYHFSLLMNPYAAADEVGTYVGFWWKRDATGIPYRGPSWADAMIPSDTAHIIAGLVGLIDGPLAGPIVERIIGTNLKGQNPDGDLPAPLFLSQAFAPTALPPGCGASTEIVVDQGLAVEAIQAILGALESERGKGRHLLGAMGVRFVPRTNALMGMNIHEMNAFIELGGMRNDTIRQVHQACWDSLDAAGIPYTCHWGQQHRLDAAHLSTYFGDRVPRWRAARQAILESATAMRVFASPALAQVGLL